MIIVEPSSDQDEHSPLKKDIEIGTTTVSPSAAPATAPPPYTLTPPPNPTPSESYQPIPHSHNDTPLRRESPIRRFLAAFTVAVLILLLWAAFVDSIREAVGYFPHKGHRHSYGYAPVRLQFIKFFHVPQLI